MSVLMKWMARVFILFPCDGEGRSKMANYGTHTQHRATWAAGTSTAATWIDIFPVFQPCVGWPLHPIRRAPTMKKQLLIDELIEDADNEPTLFQRIQLANWRGRRSILLIDGLVPGRF